MNKDGERRPLLFLHYSLLTIHCLSVQAARKPNSVLGDHSSRLAIADELQQPTRRFQLPGRKPNALFA